MVASQGWVGAHDIGAIRPADRHVEGVLDATQKYFAPLPPQRLYDRHAALFPTGRRRANTPQSYNMRPVNVSEVVRKGKKGCYRFGGIEYVAVTWATRSRSPSE